MVTDHDLMTGRDLDTGHDPEAAAGAAALRIPFVAGLDPAEQARITELSREATAAVEPWLGDLAPGYGKLTWPLAMHFATLTPELTLTTLVPVLRFVCWTFVFDDVFDEQDLSPSRFRSMMREYLEATEDQPVPPSADPLVAVLPELRAGLRVLPLFSELEDDWVRSLRGTMSGMLQENAWRETRLWEPGFLPSYQDYLRNGLQTIHSQDPVWTLLAALGDRSLIAELDHLRMMNKVLARCIRLSNDLGTYAKEAGGDGINAVEIQRAQLGDPGAAFRALRADIDEHLELLDNLARTPRTATGRAERWLAGCGRLADQFYARHDFRTFYDSEP